MTQPPTPAWLHGHAHEPNLEIPTTAPDFVITLPGGIAVPVQVADLQALPATQVDQCYIVSTGHGTSGPFTFTGVRLLDLLTALLPAALAWQQCDVISADGFGTRLSAQEVATPTQRPILLSYAVDGQALTRAQGLVRLIVPSETDDALRQVKWVGRIVIE
jgi:DMSO/TMAO reductase YedYZ molybdopterin-dependent catalytic subunit